MVDFKVQAEKIINAYAEDLEGLTTGECEEAGFSKDQCPVLTKALGKGVEGKITLTEIGELTEARFAAEFINKIAGFDGGAAIRRRAEGLMKFQLAVVGSANDKRVAMDELLTIRVWADHLVEDLIEKIEEDPHNKDNLFLLGLVGDHRAVEPLVGLAEELFEELKESEQESIGRSIYRWSPAKEELAYVMGALGQIGSSAVELLLEFLYHEDSTRRFYAAATLGDTRDGRAFNPLITTLQNDPDEEVRVHAAFGLGKLKDKRAVQPLLTALHSSSKDGRVSGAVIAALGKIGSAEAVAPLIEVVKRGGRWEGELRDDAALALGQIGPEALPALLYLLDESEGFTQLVFFAFEQMVDYHGPLSLLPALRHLEMIQKNHPEQYYRERAGSLLEKIEENLR